MKCKMCQERRMKRTVLVAGHGVIPMGNVVVDFVRMRVCALFPLMKCKMCQERRMTRTVLLTGHRVLPVGNVVVDFVPSYHKNCGWNGFCWWKDILKWQMENEE